MSLCGGNETTCMKRLAALVLAALLVPGAARAADVDLTRPDRDGTATPVRIALYLADLHEIASADQSFTADVVLQAEWLDPRLAGSPSGRPLGEVWNPRLQIVNHRGISALLPERVEVDAAGRVRYRQRWIGRFSSAMDLAEFPRDSQRFRVQVVSLGYTRADVDLLCGENGRPTRAATLMLTDWNVGPARMEAADYEPMPGIAPLAGAQLRWDGRRHLAYYAVQVILPLILIVLMGWTAVWVDAAVIPARVSISMTAMLTLIAYRFSLARSVPALTYLTRFDYFLLASTLLIFGILSIVALGARLVATGRTADAQRIDRWTRRAFPVVFTAVFIVSWWG